MSLRLLNKYDSYMNVESNTWQPIINVPTNIFTYSLSRNLSECSDDSYIQFDTRSDVKVSEKGAESENYMYTKLLKAKALELRISSDFEEDEIEDLSDEEGFDEICFEEDLLVS